MEEWCEWVLRARECVCVCVSICVMRKWGRVRAEGFLKDLRAPMTIPPTQPTKKGEGFTGGNFGNFLIHDDYTSTLDTKFFTNS